MIYKKHILKYFWANRHRRAGSRVSLLLPFDFNEQNSAAFITFSHLFQTHLGRIENVQNLLHQWLWSAGLVILLTPVTQ